MYRLLRMFLVLAVTVMLVGFSAEKEAAQKKVAVVPFQNLSGWTESRVGEIMTEQVTVALINSGKYSVMERNQLSNVIKELNFQDSGVVDPAQAIQFGQMSGTDYTIIGKVTMATLTGNATKDIAREASSRIPLGVPGLGSLGGLAGGFIDANKGVIELNVRFIDNKTGEAFKAEIIKASASDNNREIAFSKACQKAAEILLMKFQGPLGATIVDSDGTTVYIDKGAGDGLKPGDTLMVFKEGAPIKLPNGKFIVKKTPIGKIKVSEVEQDYAVCKIVDGGAAVVKNAKVGWLPKKK